MPVYAQSFAFTGAPVQVQEGYWEEFRVKLTQRPTGNVTVTVGTSNNRIRVDAQAKPAGVQFSQTFTPENWDVYQQISVGGRLDHDSNDESADVLLTASGGGYDGVTGSVAVSVLDDDLLEIVTTSGTAMIEGGSSSSITFRLSSQNRHSRTIKLTSTNDDVTFSPAELTFSLSGSGNDRWDIPQTVTVSAADDGDALDDTATINFEIRAAANGALVNTASATMTVTVRDNDAAGAGLNISAIEPAVEEKGAGVFAVRLGIQLQVAGLGFSGIGRSVPSGDAGGIHLAQSEHRTDRSNHDGAGQQFDRRRPEDQPHRIPSDHHAILGVEYR